MLMKAPPSASASLSSSVGSALTGTCLPLDRLADSSMNQQTVEYPILPAIEDVFTGADGFDEEDEGTESWGDDVGPQSPISKKREWLLRMNRRLADTPVGELHPSTVPISAIMNAWAKTKSAQGASMVEMWLKRAEEEANSGNTKVNPSTKMYTMAGA